MKNLISSVASFMTFTTINKNMIISLAYHFEKKKIIIKRSTSKISFGLMVHLERKGYM